MPAYSVWVQTATSVAVHTHLKAGRGLLAPKPPGADGEGKLGMIKDGRKRNID
ncbi:MAG: hypothetical protein AB4060_01915 [Crocosphaera sp.]